MSPLMNSYALYGFTFPHIFLLNSAKQGFVHKFVEIVFKLVLNFFFLRLIFSSMKGSNQEVSLYLITQRTFFKFQTNDSKFVVGLLCELPIVSGYSNHR